MSNLNKPSMLETRVYLAIYGNSLRVNKQASKQGPNTFGACENFSLHSD